MKVNMKVKMGSATRWLRGLLGMKKEKANIDSTNLSDKKEKKMQSFAMILKDSGFVDQTSVKNSASNATCLRSYTSESEKEQNKHAIDVAAATAAAADAAAQAAMTVVRLTSQGRGAVSVYGREKWAAIKIQAIFRGFLSRKALRALKGLVKLQALVRGYLVRKRVAATFYSMQAHIRAQASIRSQRARRSFNHDQRYQPVIRRRKSMERLEERNIPATLPKSIYGDSFFRPYSNHPSYMENTQSFKVKVRSHSAPKQRPEIGPKKKMSLSEIMASRSSFTGVKMQR